MAHSASPGIPAQDILITTHGYGLAGETTHTVLVDNVFAAGVDPSIAPSSVASIWRGFVPPSVENTIAAPGEDAPGSESATAGAGMPVDQSSLGEWDAWLQQKIASLSGSVFVLFEPLKLLGNLLGSGARCSSPGITVRNQ